MNNYEYLIASLPDITPEWKDTGEMSGDAFVDWLREGCSDSDRKLIDFLREGFAAENLNKDFYLRALSHRDRFLREYFRFDLNVRNAKVEYLNRELGRAAGTDIFLTDENGFEEEARLGAVLGSGDILSREKGIDDLMWEKIESLTTFDYFDIDAILGFIAKLNIAMRWNRLDPETGREMFSRIVKEVRGSFTGVREAADKAVS
ncbi:MAG: DUF2764 family protein [Candidatus Cryptobacteroides sp.]|nr:DUF2764 domain-containing protein [Bacteroidales bacterium]MCI7634088.1 DUF2764 domain-containing protein [Bacteroidales bacterium]MDY3227365.1 DUF2764 family protein [Candidatus Cryptobacteroides sp.]MDY5569847.1 DUF2764 family protein [Candidatus Cryptobacteroides sp.]MDY6182391.1 DUF2764 family protein [Candidatus Cryptobacteroides sp.]